MPKDKLMVQARRDVRIAHRPDVTAVKRAHRQGTRDFKEAEQRVKQMTQAFLGQLGQIPGAYQGQTSGIIGDVTSGIGALGDQLGMNNIGQVPVAEQNAGIANVQAIGSGAIEQIAGQQQNMADYLASGAQQGATQGAVTGRNYLHDYQGFLKDNRQQMVDIKAGMHSEILQRLDQLKQEQFDRNITMKQLGMQQQQIDQANAALKAEQWYREQQLKRMREADKRRDREARRDRREEEAAAAEEATTGEYGTTDNGQWWPIGGEGAFGPQQGALGGQTAPQTQLPANANPQTVLQWLQTQPMQTQSGRVATASQIVAWITHTFGGAMFAPQVMGDGTIQVNNWSAQPMPPEMQTVVNAYNAAIGGA